MFECYLGRLDLPCCLEFGILVNLKGGADGTIIIMQKLELDHSLLLVLRECKVASVRVFIGRGRVPVLWGLRRICYVKVIALCRLVN